MLNFNRQPACDQQPPQLTEAELEAAGHRTFALTIEDAIRRDPRGISFTKSVALQMAQDQWLLADLLERYC